MYPGRHAGRARRGAGTGYCAVHVVYDSAATRRLIRDAANGAAARTNGIKGANGTLAPTNVTGVLFTGRRRAGYEG